jgi:hypothetical protein
VATFFGVSGIEGLYQVRVEMINEYRIAFQKKRLSGLNSSSPLRVQEIALKLVPFGGNLARHPAYFPFPLPNRDPSTPRMICRPIWVPMERAALLAMSPSILPAWSAVEGG